MFLVAPCLRIVSGDIGEVLVDGTADNCTALPQSPDGLSVQYELSVNSACGNRNDVTVHATVDNKTDCNDLVTALSMKELKDDCSRNSMKMNRCTMIQGLVVDTSGKKICRLRCKCAESADYCVPQIYSRGLVQNPTEIKICEIGIETL